jgi:hypothetical protein
MFSYRLWIIGLVCLMKYIVRTSKVPTTYVRLPPNNDRSCLFDEADNMNIVTNHMNEKTHHHYISSSSFYIWLGTIEQSKYVTSFREKQATDHFYCRCFVLHPWCPEIGRYHRFFLHPRSDAEGRTNDVFLFCAHWYVTRRPVDELPRMCFSVAR